MWTRGLSTYISFAKDDTVRADERWRMDELVGTLFKHLPDAGRGTLVRIARVRGLQDELASNLTRATATICAGVAALPGARRRRDPDHDAASDARPPASRGSPAGRSNRKAAAEFLGAMGANVGLGFAFRERRARAHQVRVPGRRLDGLGGGRVRRHARHRRGGAKLLPSRGTSIEEAKQSFVDTKKKAEESKEADDADAKRRDWDIN